MSYLNDKVKIEKCEYENDLVTISFAAIMDLDTNDSLEEVIYTLSRSIIESNVAKKVIFMQNDHIISIK